MIAVAIPLSFHRRAHVDTMHPALELPLPAIRQFCQQHDVATLYLFGSAIREDFDETSNVDLLVEFAPNAKRGLRELSVMQNELQRLLGRPVDLVEREAIEQSRNYILRKHILGQLEPIHLA